MQSPPCDQAVSDAQEDLAYFTRLYDQAPVGYCVISEAGVILQANFKAAALLGISREDLIHRRLARFILHEGQEEFYRLRRRTEESGRPEAYELWMVRNDSTAFWAHLQFTFVAGHEDAQRSSIIQLVLTDATERMHASAKLRESEERFKYALEATRDGLWDFNLKTNKVYFSPQWLKLLGYQDDHIDDHVDFFFGLIHPDDIAVVQNSLAEHLIGITVVKQVEVRLRMKSGEYRWFFDRGEIVAWDDEGRPERMVGTLTDITERKLAEEALQESEYRWKFAIEGSGDGLWDWNIALGNVYYSKRWMGMLGFPEQEVTGDVKYWEERIHPNDQADVLAKT